MTNALYAAGDRLTVTQPENVHGLPLGAAVIVSDKWAEDSGWCYIVWWPGTTVRMTEDELTELTAAVVPMEV